MSQQRHPAIYAAPSSSHQCLWEIHAYPTIMITIICARSFRSSRLSASRKIEFHRASEPDNDSNNIRATVLEVQGWAARAAAVLRSGMHYLSYIHT